MALNIIHLCERSFKTRQLPIDRDSLIRSFSSMGHSALTVRPVLCIIRDLDEIGNGNRHDVRDSR